MRVTRPRLTYSSSLRSLSFQILTLLVEARFRGMPTAPEAILEPRVRATALRLVSTLKKALCHTRVYVERRTNTVDTRDSYLRESSCITFRTRFKTADALLTHMTINTPNN